MWKTSIAVMAFLAFMSHAALAESQTPIKTKDPIDAWMDAAMDKACLHPRNGRGLYSGRQEVG